MATELEARGTIEVNSIAADWDWAAVMTSHPEAVRLASITFIPGAANDKLVVKEDSDAGPVIFRALCTDTDEKIKYFYGAKRSVYVDFSECVLSAGHKMIIDLWPARN
ncbi:MAG: hypothetical protein OCU18_03695 [Candidatus Syntrophoarchaeum sp.]|nr:hypothetical protein [Candidatus Syntrophoarchaeum sp.]